MRTSLREILRDIGDKNKLATHLDDHPLLLLLLHTFWFRVVFLLLLAGFLCLPFVFLRIWRTSPPDFKPVIRSSGLDLAQAWSLKRAALKEEAAGRWDEALFSWRAAVANSPANPNLVRGLLQAALKSDGSPKNLGLAVGQCFWLLRLTQTNRLDVELAARVYNKFRLPDLVISSLAPCENQLTPSLQLIYLKALFDEGQMERYDQLYGKAGPEAANDAEMRLYRAAFLAGWGKPGSVTAGRQALAAAMEDPPWRVPAHRLALKVSAYLRDVDGFQKSLKRLEEWRADVPMDHVNYWGLLLEAGRKAEAVELAKTYPYPPTSALELIRMGEACVKLGLKDMTRQLLERHASQYRFADGVWMFYATFLLDDQQWDAMRKLALEIRQESAVRDQLAAFSYFLEGRAELGLDRRPSAEAAFRKASELDFVHSQLGLYVANSLNRLGFPDLAARVLAGLQTQFRDNPNYWRSVFAIANEIKQSQLLLTAASNYFRLLPNDRVAAHNYAAALLTRHERPEEAVRLTLEVLSKNPAAVPAKINHSLALVLNHRIEEAERVLQSIEADRLRPEEASSYYLSWLHIHLLRQQSGPALQAGQRINPDHLFPEEREFVGANLAKLKGPEAAEKK